MHVVDADHDVGLVYSDSYYVDKDGNPLGTAFRRAPPPAGDPFVGLLTHRNFMPCLTVLVKREAVHKVGGFDTTLKYIEDYDLFLRIASQYKVSCIREPLTQYRIHDGNLGGTGSVGMTKETLRVLKRVVERLDLRAKGHLWRIRKRLVLLWCKLVGQCLWQGGRVKTLAQAILF